MPELPEVETTRKGISPHIIGQTIIKIVVRTHRLRIPVNQDIETLCINKLIKQVERRAKYLLIELSQGTLIIHLGMSGHLRIVDEGTLLGKHDHIDLVFSNNTILRFCDPRRFGLIYYINKNPRTHKLLAHLGPEPLEEVFNAQYLYQTTRGKSQPIKTLIMNNKIVVGIGNIYATESLFFAGIHPSCKAKDLNFDQCTILVQHIKRILLDAIHAGGTSLKDFYSVNGTPGYFSIALNVYGRKNLPCFNCATSIRTQMIAGRNSAYCPRCQPSLS